MIGAQINKKKINMRKMENNKTRNCDRQGKMEGRKQNDEELGRGQEEVT